MSFITHMARRESGFGHASDYCIGKKVRICAIWGRETKLLIFGSAGRADDHDAFAPIGATSLGQANDSTITHRHMRIVKEPR